MIKLNFEIKNPNLFGEVVHIEIGGMILFINVLDHESCDVGIVNHQGSKLDHKYVKGTISIREQLKYKFIF